MKTKFFLVILLSVIGVAVVRAQKVCQMTGVVEIPVVFQMINPSATPMFTTQQVKDVLDGINNRLNGSMTANGLVVPIKLVLAKRDPSGNACTGVNQVNASAVSGYASNGFVYGSFNYLQLLNLSNWDNRYYFNIWVFNKTADANGGTLGGTLPIFNTGIKGVWIAASDFSKTSSTPVHECGHFFGLKHVYSSDCSDDLVEDTPILPIDYCDTHNMCVSSTFPYENSARNFMGIDCVNNPCDRFTVGQRDRMLSILGNYGLSLITSPGLISTSVALDAGISSVVNGSYELICGNFVPHVVIQNYGMNQITNMKVQTKVDDILMSTTVISAANLLRTTNKDFALQSIPVSLGMHNFQFIISEINGGVTDSFIPNNSLCIDIALAKDQFTIITYTDANATTTGDTTLYCGDTATVYAPPVKGKVFVNWTENDTIISTDATYTFSAFRNHFLIANYALATGIHEITTNEFGRIFPNPATDAISVEIHSKKTNTFALRIFNTLGRLLSDESIIASGITTHVIDTRSFSKGQYVITLTDEIGTTQLSFLIQ